MQYEGDDPLIHYGILGMKWGVRKDGKPQGFQYGEAGTKSKTARAARKIWKKARGTDYTPSEEHSRSRELAKKKLPEMTNQELREFNDRIRLEKEYAKLTSKDKSRGNTIADRVIKNVGDQVVQNISNNLVNVGKSLVNQSYQELMREFANRRSK